MTLEAALRAHGFDGTEVRLLAASGFLPSHGIDHVAELAGAAFSCMLWSIGSGLAYARFPISGDFRRCGESVT